MLPGPVPVTASPVGAVGGVVSAGSPWHGRLLMVQLCGAVWVAPEEMSRPTTSAEAPGASAEAQLGEVMV